MTEEKNYHFEEMPLEMIMTQKSTDDNNEYNNALWKAQSDRRKKLGLVELSLFEDLQTEHEWLSDEFGKLLKKFNKLVKLLDSNLLLEIPKGTLMDYLEDKTK